jgi:hypothetical protein
VEAFFLHLFKQWTFLDDVVVVFDGHNSHFVEEVSAVLEKHSVTVLKLPPASSPLNPVE